MWVGDGYARRARRSYLRGNEQEAGRALSATAHTRGVWFEAIVEGMTMVAVTRTASEAAKQRDRTSGRAMVNGRRGEERREEESRAGAQESPKPLFTETLTHATSGGSIGNGVDGGAWQKVRDVSGYAYAQFQAMTHPVLHTDDPTRLLAPICHLPQASGCTAPCRPALRCCCAQASSRPTPLQAHQRLLGWKLACQRPSALLNASALCMTNVLPQIHSG